MDLKWKCRFLWLSYVVSPPSSVCCSQDKAHLPFALSHQEPSEQRLCPTLPCLLALFLVRWAVTDLADLLLTVCSTFSVRGFLHGCPSSPAVFQSHICRRVLVLPWAWAHQVPDDSNQILAFPSGVCWSKCSCLVNVLYTHNHFISPILIHVSCSH